MSNKRKFEDETNSNNDNNNDFTISSSLDCVYNDEDTINNAKLYECDIDLLSKQYGMDWMPDEYRLDDKDIASINPNAKPKAKQYRKEFPDFKTQEAMKLVEQNDVEGIWMRFRGGSSGGSGLASLLGWDFSGYTDNIMQWFIESGRYLKVIGKSVDDLYFMKHGHFFENSVAQIYSVLMGTRVYIMGMLLHWACCFIHISPDGLAEYFPGVFHNKYTLRDSRRGNMEIKCPSYHVYATTNGLHTVPTHYMIQVMMQMYVFLTSWCDFTVHWRTSARLPPIDVSDKKGAGVWLVGETLVTRVYRNNKFGEKMVIYLRQFMMHLHKKDEILPFVDDSQFIYTFRIPKPNEQIWIYYRLNNSEEATDNIQLSPNDYEFDPKTGKLQILYDKNNKYNDLRFHGGPNNIKFANATSVHIVAVYPPKSLKKADLPLAVILPLKKVYWYLYCEPGAAPYDPVKNKLVGMLRPEIHDYWDQKPLEVSMEDLLTKNEDLKELDAVPAEDPMPNPIQVTNPLWKYLISLHPAKRLCDIIWDFSTSKNDIVSLNL